MMKMISWAKKQGTRGGGVRGSKPIEGLLKTAAQLLYTGWLRIK